jgi:mannan endo-1,4-beta-mannosidase
MGSRRVLLVCLSVVVALAAAAFVPTGRGARDVDGAGTGRRSRAFARASGTGFTMGGRPFFSNGFNAYWLMYMASDPGDRSKTSEALDQAASLGAKLVRTWAFSDGGHRALQVSPAMYSEEVFKVLLCRRRISSDAARRN